MEKQWNEKQARLTGFEKQYDQALSEIFDKQEKEILSNITKGVKISQPLLDVTKYAMVYYNYLGDIQNDLVLKE
jgi:hypothetical protein